MTLYTMMTCHIFRVRIKNVSSNCNCQTLPAFQSQIPRPVLKTGASGMIAYRFQKKDGEWQWLQTSSRLVYKNSKPDFVICTHRQLMEEEGRDLLGKRTMDFKAINAIIFIISMCAQRFTRSLTQLGQLSRHGPLV